MNRSHHERFLLLVIIALLLQILIQIQHGRRHRHEAAPPPPAGHGSVVQQHSQQSTPTQDILDTIADGGTMSFQDFVQKSGSTIGKFLTFANPETIKRAGNHFVITCPAPASAGSAGREILTEKAIEFDLDSSSSNVSMKNIQGVYVQWHSLPSVTLSEAVFTPGPNGETVITGQLEVGFFMPYISFQQTLDKNGDPI